MTYYVVLSYLRRADYHWTSPDFVIARKKWPFDHEDNGQTDSLTKRDQRDGSPRNPSVIGTHRDRKPSKKVASAFYIIYNDFPLNLPLS